MGVSARAGDAFGATSVGTPILGVDGGGNLAPVSSSAAALVVVTNMQSTDIDLTTDGSGDATTESDPMTGRIEGMALILPDSDPLDNAGTIVVTKTESGSQVASGTVANYTSGDLIGNIRAMAAETLTVVVAGGGDTKSGTLRVYWR